jgi:hypothetical protein
MDTYEHSCKQLVRGQVQENWGGAHLISERIFARSFGGFWAELLPFLTPSFVHMVNDGLKRRLLDESYGHVPPVEVKATEDDPALVAEFAFCLARVAADNNVSVDHAVGESSLFTLARLSAERTIYSYEQENTTPLSAIGQDEGLALAHNYEAFFCQKHASVEFSPRIAGAGFISSCLADLSVGDTLYEVKTVNRNIASKDMRQLMVYLALQAATGNRRWNKAGFFNPRRAVYHEFVVDNLVSRMSGGRPSVEVFADLVGFACNRDIQIDRAF